MKKVTVVEVQVGVSVKEGEDPVKVLEKVSTAAYAFKKELGDPELFRIQTNEVPTQESQAQG